MNTVTYSYYINSVTITPKPAGGVSRGRRSRPALFAGVGDLPRRQGAQRLHRRLKAGVPGVAIVQAQAMPEVAAR